MAYVQKTPCEVEEYLSQVTKILAREEHVIINDDEWAEGHENKTRTYMTEKNLKRVDIIKVLQDLKICNYSYTDEDRNKHFAGQEVWLFGSKQCMVDEMDELYIKIKIVTLDDDYLKVMSFHPEKPLREEDKLRFPYQK